MSLKDIGLIVFGQSASIAEIIIIVRFLIKCFGWSSKVPSQKMVFTVLCVILLAISQLNGTFRHSYTFIALIYICVLFVFCRIFLGGQMRFQIWGCLIVFLIIPASNILIMQLIALLNKIPVYRFLDLQGIGFLVGVVLSKFTLWFILSKIQKLWEKRIINLSKRYYFIVNMLIICTITIQLMLFYVVRLKVYAPIANAILIIVSVCIAMLCCYVGYSVFMISEQNTKLMNYELLQLENQEKERQIEEIERADSRAKQLRHDYKNHCMGMQELLKKGKYMELEEYLQELTGRYLVQGEEYVHTNNDMINAVINNKIWYCKEKAIDINSFITGDLSNVNNMEISVILFNLLDNAIEACLKCSDNRRIELHVCREKHYIELFIKNTIENTVLTGNKELKSSKEDKSHHGIGHVSVETIVEEADGMIEYYEADEMFCVHIFIHFH